MESARFINRMQHLAKVPLLVAATSSAARRCESNRPRSFLTPWPSPRLAILMKPASKAKITAKESRAMGFQWLFFPDADVNNNPDNPIINIRSYGEDP